MRKRSPANIAASEPPAPGRISRRHGRCAKGCTGTREVIRFCEAFTSCARVSPRSSEASDRSSGSVEASCIIEVSSVTDLVHISYSIAPAGCRMVLTSFALSHSPSAFTMGLYSPSFFAARVSKPLESFSVNSLCSVTIARALESRAGGIDSDVAAMQC